RAMTMFSDTTLMGMTSRLPISGLRPAMAKQLPCHSAPVLCPTQLHCGESASRRRLVTSDEGPARDPLRARPSVAVPRWVRFDDHQSRQHSGQPAVNLAGASASSPPRAFPRDAARHLEDVDVDQRPAAPGEDSEPLESMLLEQTVGTEWEVVPSASPRPAHAADELAEALGTEWKVVPVAQRLVRAGRTRRSVTRRRPWGRSRPAAPRR